MPTSFWSTPALRSWKRYAGTILLALAIGDLARANCISIDEPRPGGDQSRSRSGQDGANETATPKSAEGASSPAPSSIVAYRVSPQQTQMLARTLERLARVALLRPIVLICESDVINAIALGKQSGIPPEGVIVISTALMDMVGSDESKAAALLGHEIAHLIEAHGERKAQYDRRAAQRAYQYGAEQESQRRGIGMVMARQYFAAARQAYSRDIERRADDVGYQLYNAAGYDPRIVTRLFESLRAMEGDRAASYLDSHPGMDERIGRLLDLARDDAARAEVVANAKTIAAQSQQYATTAEDLVRKGRWSQLDLLVKRWLTELPESGLGWYYLGVLMQRSPKDRLRAWEAFARAAELDPERPEIWTSLAQALEESGFRKEAIASVAAMSEIGHSTEALRSGLFNDRLWVHGQPISPPVNLLWAREKSGKRVISNDRTLFPGWGLVGRRVDPEWIPVE